MLFKVIDVSLIISPIPTTFLINIATGKHTKETNPVPQTRMAEFLAKMFVNLKQRDYFHFSILKLKVSQITTCLFPDAIHKGHRGVFSVCQLCCNLN